MLTCNGRVVPHVWKLYSTPLEYHSLSEYAVDDLSFSRKSCNCTNTCTHSLSSPLLQLFAFCVSVPISLLFHFTNKEILGPEFYIVICAGRFRLGSKLVVHNNRLIWSLSHGQPNIQVRAGKGPVGLCESNKPDAQMILLTVRRGHLLSLHVTCLLYTSPSPRD